MLIELRVAELGIVSDLALVPGGHLNAITGETGAGKTLLIEALELLLGARADAGLVRDGATEARVEGRFVDPESGDEVVLARVVPVDGRSRAYVDGHMATAGELAALGARLVDLHGQHAHQTLLAPAVQRAALDRFAGAPALDALARYREARAAERDLQAELDALGGDDRARARELDLLRFQISEIEAAAIADDAEDVTLEAEESLLADVVAHRDALATAFDALEGSALDAVGSASAALANRRPFADLVARLRAVEAELGDLGSALRHERESLSDDPARVDEVRTRRQLLRELTRKYGETLAEVRRYGDEAGRRLAELEGYEARAAALQDGIADRARERADAARALSRARRAAAGGLADAVTPHLRDLAMPAARLEVLVEPVDPEGYGEDGGSADRSRRSPSSRGRPEYGEDGADRVTYLFSANPGEPARPLAKAASGGELSRAMLALRVVLSEAPPTLVFDEIDAGIGGEAGTAVGRLLADLARRHQVLCVTHLAQVAAFADTHVTVEKAERGSRTVATAAEVEGAGRVAELSRMLAGDDESTHARSHAAELLERAQRYREESGARG